MPGSLGVIPGKVAIMVNGNKPGIFRKFWYGVQFIWALIVWIVAPLLVVGRFIVNYQEGGAVLPAVKAVAVEVVYPLKLGFGVVADYWLEKPSAAPTDFEVAAPATPTNCEVAVPATPTNCEVAAPNAPRGEGQGPDSPNG